MRVIFLGTAASISNATSRLPAIALHLDTGEILLFDTGEDVQRAFEEAGLKINKRLTVLITHMHGDHVIGLPGLLFRLNLLNRTLPVEILGPRGLFFYLLAHRVCVGLQPRFKIIVKEISIEEGCVREYPPLDPGFTLEGLEEQIIVKPINDSIIKSTPHYHIKVLVADHTARQNFSFIYHEAPYPGKFDPARAVALNVPRGHLWGKLQQGKRVTLKNGQEIDPIRDGITGPLRPGRVIVISGDTRPTSALATFVHDTEVDLLIHEATYMDEFQEMANEKKHSTVGEACTMAREGRVKTLALTHFSSRHADELERLEAAAREMFGNVIVARDMQSITL